MLAGVVALRVLAKRPTLAFRLARDERRVQIAVGKHDIAQRAHRIIRAWLLRHRCGRWAP